MIFLCFSGDHGALIETEICGYGEFRGSVIGGMEFARLEAPSKLRATIQGLDDAITLLPGPSGTLTGEQAAAVAPAIPGATAGMTMLDFLALLLTATQNSSFDPEGV
jgi:hypothetical protein